MKALRAISIIFLGIMIVLELKILINEISENHTIFDVLSVLLLITVTSVPYIYIMLN